MKPSYSALIIVVAVHVGLLALVLRAAPEPKPPSVGSPTIQGVLVQAPKAITPVVPEPPKPAPPKPPEPKPEPPKPKPPEPKPIIKPKPPVAPPSERAVKAPDPEPPVEAQPEAPSEPTPEAAPAPTAPSAPTAAAPSDIVLPNSDARHLRNRQPQYPTRSRAMREQGTVILNVLVRADGTVGELNVKTSSGFKRLDEAALKAVTRWRFVPATQQGKAIDYWYELPLEFNLH